MKKWLIAKMKVYEHYFVELGKVVDSDKKLYECYKCKKTFPANSYWSVNEKHRKGCSDSDTDESITLKEAYQIWKERK